MAALQGLQGAVQSARAEVNLAGPSRSARAGVLRYYKCQFHAIMSHNDEPYCTATHTHSKKIGCEFELTSQAIPNQIHSTILALWRLKT